MTQQIACAYVTNTSVRLLDRGYETVKKPYNTARIFLRLYWCEDLKKSKYCRNLVLENVFSSELSDVVPKPQGNED